MWRRWRRRSRTPATTRAGLTPSTRRSTRPRPDRSRPPGPMTEPIWVPSPGRVARANLTRFMAELRAAGRPVTDYPSLCRWSIEQPREFWRAVWRFAGLIAEERPGRDPWDEVVRGLDRMAPPDPRAGPCWFPGARLNYAENLLRWPDEREALVAWNEAGERRSFTGRELRRAVAAAAGGLERAGVRPGDRVAGFLPNVPEAAIAMLAAASLGATWSSCSPDFGVRGVLDRFGQIEPRVLIACDGYRYAGKPIDTLDRVAEVRAALPSLALVVIVPCLPGSPGAPEARGAVSWEQFLAGGEPRESPSFLRSPFDHPLYILYSSGTTGLPKCMVHGAGGTLLQHVKEHQLHTDLTRDDRIFYFTTCGWMMWNWLVSALATGATVVLYDGAAMAPGKAALWDLAASERITVFGVSARDLALCEKEGLEPARTHDLGALRTILSTGSPLAEHSFDYVYRSVKPDVHLASISGGTDIVSCFALGNPIAPVWRGEIQTRGLGMRVEIFDEGGRPVRGRPGELCCTLPFPSMPTRFWNDADGSRYRAAYFDRFPGVWCHGDWAELTEHDGIVIHGRSDATLNPGGVRIGTAEIYRQVEEIPEVIESLVIGQEWEGDTRIVLFLRLRDGV